MEYKRVIALVVTLGACLVLVIALGVYQSLVSYRPASHLKQQSEVIRTELFKNLTAEDYFIKIMEEGGSGWVPTRSAIRGSEQLAIDSRFWNIVQELGRRQFTHSGAYTVSLSELNGVLESTDGVFSNVAQASSHSVIRNSRLDLSEPSLSEQVSLQEVQELDLLATVLVARVRAHVLLGDRARARSEGEIILSFLAALRPCRYGSVITLLEVRLKVLGSLGDDSASISDDGRRPFDGGIDEFRHTETVVSAYLRDRMSYYLALLERSKWLTEPDAVFPDLSKRKYDLGIVPLLVDSELESLHSETLYERALSRNKMRLAALNLIERLFLVYKVVQVGVLKAAQSSSIQSLEDGAWQEEIKRLRADSAERNRLRTLIK